ncbi:hypothetical protein NL676_001500 [Syzygium grande]|nr:hypothetical protein NL676_001500 [Syzygium grande]
MGMAFKIFMRLAVCYLGFSWFLLTAAVPATRSLRSSNEIISLPELQPLSLLTWKMGMAFKIFMRLAVCYLGFSWFLLTAAVPATRSLRSSNEIISLPELQPLSLDGLELMEGGVAHEVEGRVDMEIDDYRVPGANPRHSPTPPATH